jgi:hypothetical protein
MKHSFFRSRIVFFLLTLLTYTSAAFGVDQINPKPASGNRESANVENVSFYFLAFYHHQAYRLHSNMQRLLKRAGLDELILKRMTIAAEFHDYNPSFSMPALPARIENNKNTGLKNDAFIDTTKQSRVACLYENLRSPVLFPYKYTTTNKTLFSLILPIAATDQITIIPIVSYAFAMNSEERVDIKDRGMMISAIDKEGVIIYGGINFSYSF